MTVTSGELVRRKGRQPLRRKPRGKDGKKVRTRYSLGLAQRICSRIAGGASWSQLCLQSGMPAYDTLYVWRDKRPEFAAMLAQARDIAADSRAEAALEVAQATTPQTVSADRLKVSTLLWHAVRGAPGRYGSKAGAAAPADGPAAGKGRRIMIYIRQFEPVTRPDGTVFTREILPDGSVIDHER